MAKTEGKAQKIKIRGKEINLDELVEAAKSGGGSGEGISHNVRSAVRELVNSLPTGFTFQQCDMPRFLNRAMPEVYEKHCQLIKESYARNGKTPTKQDYRHRFYMHTRQELQALMKDGILQRVKGKDNEAHYRKVK